MKSLGVIVLLVLSVTAFLHIPPASATDLKVVVNPEKATFGQTVNVYIEYFDSKAHLVELTFYYGGAELETADTWMNNSILYQWMIKQQWSLDPTTGGEGGYDIRVWVDNKTAWGNLWVEKTWTQIGKENRQNVDRMIASNEELGKAIILAEYGLFALFVVLIIIASLAVQHRLARKLHKRSIVSSAMLWIQLNLLRLSPAALNRVDETSDAVLRCIDDIYASVNMDPAKIHMGNFALAQKNLTYAVENLHNKAAKGQGAKA